jgi:hypothetical protein
MSDRRSSLNWPTFVAMLLVASSTSAAQQSTRSAFDVITVTGCVEPEATYRAQIGGGKGGPLGSGAGEGNEFVLRSVVSVSPDTLEPRAKPSTAFEEVYRLTGSMEHELASAVGKQVDVSGYVEVAKTDGTEKVKDLPNMKIEGWHVASARCTAPRQP